MFRLEVIIVDVTLHLTVIIIYLFPDNNKEFTSGRPVDNNQTLYILACYKEYIQSLSSAVEEI